MQILTAVLQILFSRIDASLLAASLPPDRLEKDRQEGKREVDDLRASLDHVTKDKVIVWRRQTPDSRK
jgi:hypothetical protein